jgi:WD40 repeat protein
MLFVPLVVVSVVTPAGNTQTPVADFDKATATWKLPWDEDWVTAVCFVGPNRVAAGNNRGHILVWDLPEKAGDRAPSPARRLDGHTNTINRLLTTPDGRWLLSASNDHTIRCWDLQAKPAKSDKVVLNARAREEATIKKRKVPPPVEVEVEVQEAARVLIGHKDWVLGLALSQDGNLVVSGDDKGEVIVRDFAAGKELRRWKVKGWVYALALSPDARSLLVSERLPLVFDSGRHAGLKLWEVETGKVLHDLGKDFNKQFLSAAAFSSDGKLAAVGRGGEVDGPNGIVTLLDSTTGKKMRECKPGHLYGITDLAFHPDGKHLFSSGRDTLVRVWRVEDGKLVQELGQSRGGQFKDWIHALSISRDGRWLAAADMAGHVQVWALNARLPDGAAPEANPQAGP